MWFLFGFITLVSFSIYAGYKRVNASWRGDPGRIPDLGHQYRIVRNKGKMTSLLIGIDGPAGYDFLLKHESWYDRLGKFLGLSVEQQIGNPTFDDLVYIVSDDRPLQMQVAKETAIVDSVIQLFAVSAECNGQLRQIRCNSGRLWVVITVGKDFDAKQINNLSDDVALLLREIASRLRNFPLPTNSKWRDPFVLKAAVILAISSGLALNGLVQMVRLVWSSLPWTLDWPRLMLHATIGGGVLILLLALAALVFLGRSARTHLVLIELCLIGLFGATATAFTELRDINMEFDKTPGIEYRAKTLNKRISRSRRSTSYYLYLADWTGEDERRRVAVARDFYDQVAIGETLLVTQKPGFFAYRWVESIVKPEPENLW